MKKVMSVIIATCITLSLLSQSAYAAKKTYYVSPIYHSWDKKANGDLYFKSAKIKGNKLTIIGSFGKTNGWYSNGPISITAPYGTHIITMAKNCKIRGEGEYYYPGKNFTKSKFNKEINRLKKKHAPIALTFCMTGNKLSNLTILY